VSAAQDWSLSDEQMAVLGGTGISGWGDVPRPTGRQPLPDWVKGAHVDWMNGASNAPTVKLKVAGDVYNWDEQRWAKEGAKMYITRHSDGRARVYYHDGARSQCAAYRFADAGSIPKQPADHHGTYGWNVTPEEGWADHVLSIRATWTQWRHASTLEAAQADGEKHLNWLRERGYYSAEARVETQLATATTEQGGFGGANIWMTMLDGSALVLRGPWHGGAPAGYVEVSTSDCSEPAYGWKKNRQWHQRGGCGGLYITEDLFLRIMARHCAHVPIARVQHSYGVRLEPYRAEWEMPKAPVYYLELGRAQRNEPAGPFWRVYWDGTERYCGSLRVPSHGYQDGVTDRVSA